MSWEDTVKKQIKEQLWELQKIITEEEGTKHYKIIENILKIIEPRAYSNKKLKIRDLSIEKESFEGNELDYFIVNNRDVLILIEFKTTQSDEFREVPVLYNFLKMTKDRNEEIKENFDRIINNLKNKKKGNRHPIGFLKKKDEKVKNIDKDEIGQIKRYCYNLRKKEYNIKLPLITDGFTWLAFNFNNEVEKPLSFEEVRGWYRIDNESEFLELIRVIRNTLLEGIK
jgi:hypothetical protein